MQNYIDLAIKNGIKLLETGKCQFCGAETQRGVHECLEIFNIGFQEIDFSNNKNHIYRFLIVDAHTLQHPEIHGRWNNHFHLTRLHLIFKYDIMWSYKLSPKLSDFINTYKIDKEDEYLIPPQTLKRGTINTIEVQKKSTSEIKCKEIIKKWALEVYIKWNANHNIADYISKGFLSKTNYNLLEFKKLFPDINYIQIFIIVTLIT